MAGGPKNVWEKIGVITAFILAVTGIVAVLQECSGPKPPPPEKEAVLCCDRQSKTSCKLPNPVTPNPGKAGDLCRCPGAPNNMIGQVSRWC
jgi:hypothetical protein